MNGSGERLQRVRGQLGAHAAEHQAVCLGVGLALRLVGDARAELGGQVVHHDPAVRTEAQLEVTLGGRRWRITRSPQQERLKKSGTGTTTEQAKVLLEALRAGAWETVSTRIDEAAAELDPLLGMSSWYAGHLDHQLPILTGPAGPFADCEATQHFPAEHDRLHHHPAPADWWPTTTS